MGYLCRNLPSLGWKPVVVCEQLPANHFEFLEHTAEVHAVSISDHDISRRPVISRVADSLFHHADRLIEQEAERIMPEHDFKAVLCSTYRLFPLRAAQAVARRHRLPLVADLRDILEEYAPADAVTRSLPTVFGMDRLIRRMVVSQYVRQRNRLIAQAACVTTISQWHVELLRQVNSHTKLIYNGFDETRFFPDYHRQDHFTITYTGRIVSLQLRDPSLLLQALSQLVRTGQLPPGDVQVRWFVDDASRQLLRDVLQPYPELQPMMLLADMQPATDVPRLLNESDIVLVLANRTQPDGPHGIMTTKLFETLATGRPTLCVRSDEAEIERLIQDTQAGLAARTAEQVSDFIKTSYAAWRNQSDSAAPTDVRLLKPYSRASQAAQFARILDSITQPTAQD